MPADRLEFRLLGAVEATVSGRPVELGRRQERCLLGLLLLEADRPMPLDQAQQALAIAQRHGHELFAGQAFGALAEVHLSMMDADRAIDCVRQALASHLRTGHRPGAERARAVLARAGVGN